MVGTTLELKSGKVLVLHEPLVSDLEKFLREYQELINEIGEIDPYALALMTFMKASAMAELTNDAEALAKFEQFQAEFKKTVPEETLQDLITNEEFLDLFEKESKFLADKIYEYGFLKYQNGSQYIPGELTISENKLTKEFIEEHLSDFFQEAQNGMRLLYAKRTGLKKVSKQPQNSYPKHNGKSSRSRRR